MTTLIKFRCYSCYLCNRNSIRNNFFFIICVFASRKGGFFMHEN